ncbi:hypothetical protein A6R68_24025, partial [Neotoma lepida]
STLTGMSHLCGTRLCHEIAHAWFGLAIGARDWTEEWLSEGFATHLEDVFWAEAQQLSPHEALEQQELRACLRWHRLKDELQNSPEEMQVLRYSTILKHGPSIKVQAEVVMTLTKLLRALKFTLHFQAQPPWSEYEKHLSQRRQHVLDALVHCTNDFLQMLLESIPEDKRLGLSVENIVRDWLECSGIPK